MKLTLQCPEIKSFLWYISICAEYSNRSPAVDVGVRSRGAAPGEICAGHRHREGDGKGQPAGDGVASANDPTGADSGHPQQTGDVDTQPPGTEFLGTRLCRSRGDSLELAPGSPTAGNSVAGSRIHREAAGPGVLSVLDALGAALSGRGFYMAGGTALALFEGHRISVDVDLFSKEIKDPESLPHSDRFTSISPPIARPGTPQNTRRA